METELLTFPRKTITKTELVKLTGISDESALFQQLKPHIHSGLLKPFGKETNGNRRYPLHLKYRIVKPAADHSAALAGIAGLHSLLQANGALVRHPEWYELHCDALQCLSAYLFRRPAEEIPVSRKERSFEIFGEEKLLDDDSFCHMLKSLEITEEMLGFYDTPAYCFHDYIPQRLPQMTLLICENKDIWFNLRRRMFEDHARTLWETPIDGVVYGEGERICKQDGALTEYTRFLGDCQVQYLYWGDIDREGLNIFLRLVRANPGLEIRLFDRAYKEMLHRAAHIRIPHSADLRGQQEDYNPVLAQFPEPDRQLLQNALADNLRIPQEIISYAVLRQEMR